MGRGRPHPRRRLAPAGRRPRPASRAVAGGRRHTGRRRRHAAGCTTAVPGLGPLSPGRRFRPERGAGRAVRTRLPGSSRRGGHAGADRGHGADRPVRPGHRRRPVDRAGRRGRRAGVGRVAVLATGVALAPARVRGGRGAGGQPARPLQPGLPAQLRGRVGDLRPCAPAARSAWAVGGRVGGVHAGDDADRLVALRPAGAAVGAGEPARAPRGRSTARVWARVDRVRLGRWAAGGAAAVDRRPARGYLLWVARLCS
jgi:hypothetical protein